MTFENNSAKKPSSTAQPAPKDLPEPFSRRFNVTFLVLELIGIVIFFYGFAQIGGMPKAHAQLDQTNWTAVGMMLTGVVLMLPFGVDVLRRNFTGLSINQNQDDDNQHRHGRD